MWSRRISSSGYEILLFLAVSCHSSIYFIEKSTALLQSAYDETNRIAEKAEHTMPIANALSRHWIDYAWSRMAHMSPVLYAKQTTKSNVN